MTSVACPVCEGRSTHVVKTISDEYCVVRWRKCAAGHHFQTQEVVCPPATYYALQHKQRSTRPNAPPQRSWCSAALIGVWKTRVKE